MQNHNNLKYRFLIYLNIFSRDRGYSATITKSFFKLNTFTLSLVFSDFKQFQDVHGYVSTGQEGSKFGIPGEELDDVLGMAVNSERIRVVGLHCHIGSTLTDSDKFRLVFFFFNSWSVLVSLVDSKCIKGLFSDKVHKSWWIFTKKYRQNFQRWRSWI